MPKSNYTYDEHRRVILGPGLGLIGCPTTAFESTSLIPRFEACWLAGIAEGRSRRGNRPRPEPRVLRKSSASRVRASTVEARAGEILRELSLGATTYEALFRKIGGGRGPYHEAITALMEGRAMQGLYHGAKRIGIEITERGRELLESESRRESDATPSRPGNAGAFDNVANRAPAVDGPPDAEGDDHDD